MAQQTWNFDDATGLTFNTEWVEVAGGALQLVQYNPANVRFYASYNTSINADISLGNPAGTAHNGAAITTAVSRFGAGCLYTDPAQAGSGIQYAAAGVDPGGGQFTFRLWFRPNYSGTHPGVGGAQMMSFERAANNRDALQMRQTLAGSLQMLRRDVGGNPHNFSCGAWSPTADQWYFLEYGHDANTPASRFFVDGVQLCAPDVQVYARNPTDQHWVGRWKAGTTEGAGHFDDVHITTGIAHTANYTPPEAPVGGYPTNAPLVIFDQLFNVTSFHGFGATIVGVDTIRWAVRMRGWQWWFNGRYWDWRPTTIATANETCSTAQMMANIRYLKPMRNAQLVAYFGGDGSATPQLDQLVLRYSPGWG